MRLSQLRLVLVPFFLVFDAVSFAQTADAPPPLPPPEQTAPPSPPPPPPPSATPVASSSWQAPTDPRTVDQSASSSTESSSHPRPWFVMVGGRVSWVPSAGYEPFSEDDGLGGVDASGTYALYERDRFAFAAGLGAGISGSGAHARGARSRLNSIRAQVPLELRVRAWSWLHAFGRISPGLAYQTLAIEEPGAPATLVDDRAVFATDVSLGLAAISKRRVGFGGALEGGYGFAASMTPSMKPDLGSDDARQVGTIGLPSLNTSGAFVRISAVMRF